VTPASMTLHRHPDWWNEPLRFDPDRFAPERAEHLQHSHLFVPFGGGAHLCIGNHVAELITKTVVARLLARRRVSADPRAGVVIQPVPIPKPRGALLLQLS
jgi:cytochrome P450